MLVRSYDIDNARDDLIVILCDPFQIVPPVLEFVGDLAALQPNDSLRHVCHGGINDRVAQCILNVTGLNQPLLQTALVSEATVLFEATCVKSAEVSVLVTEVLELRVKESDHRRKQAVQSIQGPVPIARDGAVDPALSVWLFERRPPPLITMSIPVRHQHVQQPGTNIRVLIDRVIVILLDLAVHLGGTHHLVGIPVAINIGHVVIRSILDHHQLIGESVEVGAQPRIARHVHKIWPGVIYACRRREPGNYVSAVRVD